MPKIPLNDLSRRSTDEVDQIMASVRTVVERGTFLKGPETTSLEQNLQKIIGNPVVAVASGTDALIASLTYALTHGVTALALVPNAGGYGTIAANRVGLKPVYVDVDPVYGQMSPVSLRETLSGHPEVGAVLVTHLYGICGDVAAIREICDDLNLLMIEDCAQSLGAVKEGRSSGSFGDLATLSFYPTKNLGGMGDGGAVVCSTNEIRGEIVQVCQYGWGQRYEVVSSGGFNSRIDEIQAAIINHELLSFEFNTIRRRAIADRYRTALRRPRYLVGSPDEDFVAHLAVVSSPDRVGDRDRLRELEIETGIHYPLLDHQQPAWRGNGVWNTPNAEVLNSSIFTLPCFPSMTEFEINRVCEALATLT
jgi:dTDP-4-amino-4,6-dideoxygalactose transaminase